MSFVLRMIVLASGAGLGLGLLAASDLAAIERQPSAPEARPWRRLCRRTKCPGRAPRGGGHRTAQDERLLGDHGGWNSGAGFARPRASGGAGADCARRRPACVRTRCIRTGGGDTGPARVFGAAALVLSGGPIPGGGAAALGRTPSSGRCIPRNLGKGAQQRLDALWLERSLSPHGTRRSSRRGRPPARRRLGRGSSHARSRAALAQSRVERGSPAGAGKLSPAAG